MILRQIAASDFKNSFGNVFVDKSHQQIPKVTHFFLKSTADFYRQFADYRKWFYRHFWRWSCRS
jgi:hypothetical protein